MASSEPNTRWTAGISNGTCCVSHTKEKRAVVPSQIWTYLRQISDFHWWPDASAVMLTKLRRFSLHLILFAPASNSLSVTSLPCLIRFAIFRPSDVHPANSANIFLQFCVIKGKSNGPYMLLIQLCDTIVSILTVYLNWIVAILICSQGGHCFIMFLSGTLCIVRTL